MIEPVSTRQRIIDIAGEIFGRDGFKAATIRKIAMAAGANTASINYHFRDKEGLYRAVLEDLFARGFQRYPPVPAPGESADPEERLRIFIRALFHRFLGHDGWGGFSGRGRLIAREFLDPTPALDDILETYIQPHKGVLAAIISDLAGGRMPRDRVLPCAVSIIGQCVYYAFAGPVIRKIAGELIPSEENLDTLADHVFRFSLGGIEKAATGDPGVQEENP